MHPVHGWLRSNGISIALTVLFVGSALAFMVDDTRFWCGGHPIAVVRTGDFLGIPPSRFIRHKAEVEEAALALDWGRAMSIVKEWIVREGAVDGDPHPGWGSMLSWETEAPATFGIACAATRIGIGW